MSEKACCVTLTLPTMPRRLLLAVLLALALPASASAGLATLQVRELPLHGERSLAAVTAASPFQLVGIHWQGSGRLELRIRTARGWSAWRPVRADVEDTPDATSREARAMRGWRLGEPVWVGRGEGLEVRAIGQVTRARALTVRSPVSKVPLRTAAAAGLPRIVPRSGWQADESIVRAKPQYADALRMAYVHHTAGTNGYTRLQAPAIVRAIELYHVKGNGWNDIGYNALVDRFGTVYEGRAGGVDRNVVGAHAKGFNTGSFGIAVMGDFRTADPSAAAVDALVKTLAWRLDLAHVDPLGTLNGISSGNERFGPGIPVFLRAISGHRDTGLTTCPGQKLYDLIPGIAKRVAALGLPKIYMPAVAADESGGTRFTAKLSSPLPWAVRITGPAGTRARARRGHRRDGRLDMACRRPGAGRHPMGDLVSRRDRGDGLAVRDRCGCARPDRPAGRPRDDHAERRRPGGHHDHLVHAEHERQRGRERPRRRRRDGRASSSRGSGGARAPAASCSTAGTWRTARTSSTSRRTRPAAVLPPSTCPSP